MERIKSFTINHDVLMPGFYISRVDGDITTYDLRTRRPNMGDYMSDLTMHSVEHMFATLVRNSEIADDVIYFGPMGCQTGFYLLVRNADHKKVFEITKALMKQIAEKEEKMYGQSAVECGNYRCLDIDAAKKECAYYADVLEHQTDMTFTYPE